MDTELLRTFLEVANTRHFGRASDNLCLTQSAVSFRIRQLESLVGTELFSRKRGNIMLTAAGERLQPYAESILSTWQSALQESGVVGQRRQLSLGAAAILWESFLSVPIQHVIRHSPEFCWRTEVDQRKSLLRGLLESRLDIVFSFTPPKLPDIHNAVVGQLVLQLATDQPHRALTELTELNYVHLDWDTAFNLPSEQWWLPPVAPILHTGQMSLAVDFLTRNGGVALLPKAIPQVGQTLFAVEGVPPIERDIYASWLDTNPAADDCREAVAQLQACFSGKAAV